MATLDTKLDGVVGGKTAKALERAFDMHTVADLLGHYPRRLAERGELTDLASLRIDEDVTVVADVISAAKKGPPQNPRLEILIGDATAKLQLVFFGRGSVWRERELRAGTRGLFAGKVGEFNGRRQLVHPEYMLLHGDPLDDVAADIYAGRLIPVYPATQKVRSWVIANAVRHVLDSLDPIPDPLDAELRARRDLLSLDAAVRAVHEPDTREQWWQARRRLAWRELEGVERGGMIRAQPEQARGRFGSEA